MLAELKISNFQKITAVNLRPEGHTVLITGACDQGKTSIIRAIWTLLVGKSAAPPKLIRDGEEECHLYGDFGSFRVARTFRQTDDGDITMDLTVTKGDGSPVRKTPQGVLNAMLGAYSFDPLSFARAPAKDQFEQLKKLVPGVDFDKLADERKKHFDSRTEANRKADAARAQANGIKLPPGPCPKAIDVTAQLAALNDANTNNASIPLEVSRRSRLEFDVARIRREAEEKRSRALALRKQAEDLEADALNVEAAATAAEVDFTKLPPLPQSIDITEIQKTIGDAERVKGVRVMFENRRRYQDEAEKWEGESESLTLTIQQLDAKKVEAIAAAKLPVDGLTLGDGEILLNDIPFEQAGTMVKIKTSVAIGMALNPELRIMTIDEGSELDSKGLAALEDMAEANDFQLWIVRVDESGQNGFVMVDGHLAEEAV
jgi:hypothetical protein